MLKADRVLGLDPRQAGTEPYESRDDQRKASLSFDLYRASHLPWAVIRKRRTLERLHNVMCHGWIPRQRFGDRPNPCEWCREWGFARHRAPGVYI